MAIGLFKLTYNQRKILAAIFAGLNIIEILFGAAMTGLSIYVYFSVSPLVVTEKAEINFIFVVYGLFGFNVMINWLVGIQICYKCFHRGGRKSTRSLLLFWYCAGTNTAVMLFIIANMSRKANKNIEKSMKQSVQGNMKMYLTNLEAKESIDMMQYKLECCGWNSYEDWHKIEWMDKTMINADAKLVDELRINPKKYYFPITPWSCCKISFPMECFHDPLQQTEYKKLWVDTPDTVKQSLNTKGCSDILRAPINWITTIMFSFIYSIIFLHIIICLVSRILFTSCRNAILLFDDKGIAPGWIFGRGDCGYARGKTLTEIMGITNDMLNERIMNNTKTKTKSKPNKRKTPIKDEPEEA